MNKEIICINIGQAGVQMSSAAWELLCIEHGLDVDGSKRRIDAGKVNVFTNYDPIHTFFHDGTSGKYVPRAITIDLEATVIDEIRCGPYRKLWHPNCLISGIEDAANNFARGKYTNGKKIEEKFFTQLLKLVRETKHLHGFIIMNSIGGGTGSGLSSLLLERLDNEFGKKPRFVNVVIPAPEFSTSVVEPYNASLATGALINYCDLVMMCDNESLYRTCQDRLRLDKPVYNNLNRIISQLFSSLTVSFRFPSSLDFDLGQLQTNLVPYPRIHFPFANYAPINNTFSQEHESLSTYQITQELFEPLNQFLRCNIHKGKYLACSLQYRGMVLPHEVNVALNRSKSRIDVQFVDWCPTGFKVGISTMPPGVVVDSKIAGSIRNVAMFSNNSAAEEPMRRLMNKFDLLHCRKAFVHWFLGEGMEEMEFCKSREELQTLQKDYLSLGRDQKDPATIHIPKHSDKSQTNASHSDVFDSIREFNNGNVFNFQRSYHNFSNENVFNLQRSSHNLSNENVFNLQRSSHNFSNISNIFSYYHGFGNYIPSCIQSPIIV